MCIYIMMYVYIVPRMNVLLIFRVTFPYGLGYHHLDRDPSMHCAV